MLQGLVASETAALEAAKAGAAQWQQEAEWARELDAAFGRTGVQSFALEGVLGELQVRGLLLYHLQHIYHIIIIAVIHYIFHILYYIHSHYKAATQD